MKTRNGYGRQTFNYWSMTKIYSQRGNKHSQGSDDVQKEVGKDGGDRTGEKPKEEERVWGLRKCIGRAGVKAFTATKKKGK